MSFLPACPCCSARAPSRSGSIYKSPSAQLPDASMQQRLVARAADIGKHWPELPVARKRTVLTALIERIEVSVDQIDIRLRPPRLGAPLDQRTALGFA